jgi:hypothetical protein
MKDKEYVNINSTCLCKGNVEADKLFYMLESTGVLSEKLTDRIRGILYVIVCNFNGNEEYVKTEIERLDSDMRWLNIFDDKFIENLHIGLLGSLVWEMENKLS